jgi:hypothetical protein
MNFSDLTDPRKLREILFRLFICFVALLAACCMLSQISAADVFKFCLLLILLSPVAYLIRQSRLSPRERPVSRRGAERTPSLPPNEDAQ